MLTHAFGTGAREMSESALLVAIATVIVLRLRPRVAVRVLAVGVSIGVGASVVAGGFLLATGLRVGQAGEDVFEGAVMLVMGATLAWTARYLARAPDLKAPPSGKPEVPLAALSILAIVREMPESAIEITDSTPAPLGVALLMGTLGAALVFLAGGALAAIAIRSPWNVVRRGLVGAVVLIGAGLISHATTEFASAGLVEPGRQVWDLAEVLPHDHGLGRWLRIFTGYSARMTVLELLTWLGYIAVVGLLLRKRAGVVRPP